MQLITSHRLTTALATLVICLNGAYLIKNGSLFGILNVALVVTIAVVAVAFSHRQKERTQQDGETTVGLEPRLWSIYRNGLLLFLLATSAYGIFG